MKNLTILSEAECSILKRFKLFHFVSSSFKWQAGTGLVMDTDAVKQGLQHMADEMVVASEPVTIDKVVDRYRDVLRAARELGLRWASIARLVVRSDGNNAADRAVSAQHLRASYSRSLRKAEAAGPLAVKRQRSHDDGRGAEAPPEAQAMPVAEAPTARRKARSPPPCPAANQKAQSGRPTQADPSEAELAAARRRLS